MGKGPPPRASRPDFGGLLPRADDPEALVRANRLAALGTLVAGVAHEINNPISYVLGNLSELETLGSAMREALGSYRQSLVCEAGSNGAVRAEEIEKKLEEAGGLALLEELLADAQEGAGRIRDLIRDLLLLSYPSESRSLIDVGEILDSALRLLGRKLAGVARVERSYTARYAVSGDRGRLGQVFLNLISNAIDACQPPDDEAHTLRVTTADEGDAIRVDIEDTGVGIPEDLQGRVFRPFFTTKAPGAGTGLGLYIARRIVEGHAGRIRLSSAPGSGTRVSVYLPVG